MGASSMFLYRAGGGAIAGGGAGGSAQPSILAEVV